MVKITIELPNDLYNKICSFLENSELTIEEFIVQAIKHELQRLQIIGLIKGFKDKIDDWSKFCPSQNFVFNTELECENTNWGNIKYIIVGDNPGINEKEKKRYLVPDTSCYGASGSIAERLLDNYMKMNDSDYIVLNKCPIFTGKTDKLDGMCLLQETQEYMANLIFKLHGLIGRNCKVYIFGFGETCINGEWQIYTNNSQFGKYKKGDYKGTMSFFFEKLKQVYNSNSELKKSLILAKHFSGNNIFEDLVSKIEPEILIKALESLEYKDKLFEK